MKKKKQIEVYFVIYLSLLVSFLAIEDELIEYQERQERVLFQVAQSETNKLIDIGELVKAENTPVWRMDFDIAGDFEEGSLQAEAVLIPRNNPDLDTVHIQVMHDESKLINKYSFEADRNIFQNNQQYRGVLRARIRPKITQRILEVWKQSFGDTVVPHILAEKIMHEDEIVINQPLQYIFGDEIQPLFSITPGLDEYRAVQGTIWEARLTVAGLPDVDDLENSYSYNITLNDDLISGRSKDGDLLLLEGRAGAAGGRIRVEATRNSDGEIARTEFIVSTVPPSWIYDRPAPEMMYLGESATYRGALEGIPSGDIQIRARGVCIGDQILPVNGELPACEIAGTINLTPVVQGQEIEDLALEVRVVEPPPPDIFFSTRNGNQLTFNIRIHGRNNCIKVLQPVEGVAGEIIRNQEERDGSILTQEVQLNIYDGGGKATQRVHFIIIDCYGRKSEHNEEYQL